jgi:hypothetical protein
LFLVAKLFAEDDTSIHVDPLGRLGTPLNRPAVRFQSGMEFVSVPEKQAEIVPAIRCARVEGKKFLVGLDSFLGMTAILHLRCFAQQAFGFLLRIQGGPLGMNVPS